MGTFDFYGSVVENVSKTYPSITDAQRAFIAGASLSAAEILVEDGRISAINNAREDNYNADTSNIVRHFQTERITDESAYEIARDIARFVMHTWNVAEKFDADSVGYHFVMTRNGEGVSFKDDQRFPDGGSYLAFVTENLFGFPWHCEADETGVSIYAM
ncbi:hypothetical protein AB0K16_22205 [Nonomuraea jabiensis]|uniref:hypothetical protein n=1 Tax=Nonomuraea jabiensis TaxID=882448 RepID=UPI00341468FF